LALEKEIQKLKDSAGKGSGEKDKIIKQLTKDNQ